MLSITSQKIGSLNLMKAECNYISFAERILINTDAMASVFCF